jgi:phosphodiesterase/alkaline phosphatase D-like protein
VKAVNTAGTTYGADSTFTTSAIAPTADTKSASSISSTAATLNGTVNANNASSVVTFDYGTSTSYGSSATAAQSPVTGTSATSVSYALSGLTPNTTYHFRVKAVNTAGTTYGADSTFTTSAIAPTAVTKSASSISSTAATLNGTVNANNATAVVTFDYGTSTSYGSSATAAQSPVTGTSATSVSYALSGLTPNTTYHFRVKAVNTAGTTYGADSTFTTSKIAPVVTTQAVTNVSSTSATGNGTITVLGSPAPIAHGVCWNTTGTPTVADAKIDSGAVSSTGAFTVSITGLTINTTYYVRAYAISVTDTVYGNTESFSTSATGINTVKAEKVTLYPNPVKDAFQISGINGKAEITVLDVNGKTLFTKDVTSNESISANTLPQGVYIVRITTEGTTVEQKIVKK